MLVKPGMQEKEPKEMVIIKKTHLWDKE